MSAPKVIKKVYLAPDLKDAEPGDLVLTPKVDRWGRDLPSGVASVRELVARGWGLVYGGGTKGIMGAVASGTRAAIDRCP